MEADEILSYCGELSKFELLQLFHLQKESIVDDITIFMTVLFGFIAMAYFVGEKLSRSQAVSVSLIYSVFALLALASIWSTTMSMSAALVGGFLNLNYSLVGTLAVCWAYSILFLVQVRRTNERAT